MNADVLSLYGALLALALVAFIAVLHLHRSNRRLREKESALIGQRDQARNMTRLLRLLIDTMPTHMFLKNPDDGFSYEIVNKRMSDQFARHGKDLIGRTAAEVFDPETAARARAEDEEVMASGVMHAYDHVAVFGDGTRSYVHVHKVPFVDSNGQRRLLGVGVDTTSFEATRRELAAINSSLEELFLRSDGGIGDLSSVVGTLVDFTNADCGFVLRLDSGRPEVTDVVTRRGRTDFERLVGELHQFSDAECETLFNNLERQHSDVFIYNTSNPFDLRALNIHRTDIGFTGIGVVRLAGGRRPWGCLVLGFRRVFTEFEPAQLRVIEAFSRAIHNLVVRDYLVKRVRIERDAALRAEETKDIFFSSVSHDIRTPLHAIIGLSELLRSGSASEAERVSYLDSIVFSGRMLMQLVNDVLDISKLERGKMTIVPEPMDVAATAKEILDAFRSGQSGANAGAVEYRLESAGFPKTVWADPQRIRQILFNLVGNSAKFTTAGAITVRLGWRDDPSPGTSSGTLLLSVSDTGCGIPKSDFEHILQPYVQVAGTRGGTGLGLAICNRLAKLMGGRLELESEVGKGSTFTLIIPDVSCDPRSAGHAAHLSASANLSVLFVDDSPVNRLVAKGLLNRIGVSSLVLAADGAEALQQVAKTHFDVVFTDLQMPRMDGFAFIEAIRSNADTVSLPVYLVTSEDDIAGKAVKAGFTGVIPKPLESRPLTEVLARLAQ